MKNREDYKSCPGMLDQSALLDAYEIAAGGMDFREKQGSEGCDEEISDDEYQRTVMAHDSAAPRLVIPKRTNEAEVKIGRRTKRKVLKAIERHSQKLTEQQITRLLDLMES